MCPIREFGSIRVHGWVRMGGDGLMTDVHVILKKALNDEIGKDEALMLFRKVQDRDGLLELLRIASKVRDDEVGNEIKLMGFIASITPCTVDPPCRYCFRWANKKLFNWDDVLTDEELTVAMKTLSEKGLKRVEVGGGTYLGEEGRKMTFHKLSIACGASRDVGVWITNVSFLPEDVYRLKDIGVEGVTCNLETINEEAFRRLRPGLDFDLRKRIIEESDKAGLGIDNTLMIGLGEDRGQPHPYEDWVEFFFYFKRFKNLRIIEVHPFRPTWGSPTQDMPSGSEFETLKAMAIARLIYRNVDISGAHTVQGLLAGANLIMHVYPITKSFRPWGKHGIFASKIERLVGDAVMVDNLFEVTRNAKEMGFEIEIEC